MPLKDETPLNDQSPLPDKRLEETPERIWIDGSGKDRSFWNDNGDAVGTVEYVRADLLQQPTSERCGERPLCLSCGAEKTSPECGKCGTVSQPPLAATGADEGQLIDEVQRRMDAVVEAAVEWHQSGREGDDTWFDKSEALSAAINSLLELRAAPPANVVEAPSSEAAIEAAREWMNTHHASFETNEKREQALAAIISKHIPDAGEIERLKFQLFAAQEANRLGDKMISDARANAIREAVAAVKRAYNPSASRDRCDGIRDALAALQSLIEQPGAAQKGNKGK